MTCITPSHEETISEGVSCTLLDTVDALATENDRDKCLLGEPKETDGIHLEEETVQGLLEKMKMDFKNVDLPFLKAQMYKNFKAHIDPSLSGGKETERIVKYKRKSSSRTSL